MRTQEELTKIITQFIEERNWSQFHSGKDFAMSLSIEANETMELFLWKKNDESVDICKLKDELGDVYYSLLLLADRYQIDLEEALCDKLEINRTKYPVDEFFGKNRKYSDHKVESGS